MRKKFRSAALAALALVLPGCTVGHSIKVMPSTVAAGDQAAYYALPRTVVTATFPVTKTEIKEGTGKSANQTSCFSQLGQMATFKGVPSSLPLWDAIGLDSAPAMPDPSFKITGPPIIGSAPEPDPDAIFRVDLGSSWAIKRELSLAYGPLGVLESGTSFVQDRRVDLAVGFVKSALKIFTYLFDSSRAASAPAKTEVDCREETDPCQRAACEIYQARQALYELPERVTENKLDADRAAWLETRYRADIDKRIPVFIRQLTEKAEVVCAVRPSVQHASMPYQVLRFEGGQGVLGGSDADCRIPNGFQWLSTPKTWATFDLHLSPFAGQYEEKLKTAGVPNAHNPNEEQGFYYRVPALADVKVMKGTEVLAQADMIVAQLGFVAALPRQRTYQTKYTVKLDPATGALTTLDASSDAVDPALITGTGDAIASVLEARKEAQEAEAAAKDELAQLERERKILEARVKIREYRETLGETEPPIP